MFRSSNLVKTTVDMSLLRKGRSSLRRLRYNSTAPYASFSSYKFQARQYLDARVGSELERKLFHRRKPKPLYDNPEAPCDENYPPDVLSLPSITPFSWEGKAWNFLHNWKKEARTIPWQMTDIPEGLETLKIYLRQSCRKHPAPETLFRSIDYVSEHLQFLEANPYPWVDDGTEEGRVDIRRELSFPTGIGSVPEGTLGPVRLHYWIQEAHPFVQNLAGWETTYHLSDSMIRSTLLCVFEILESIIFYAYLEYIGEHDDA